MSRIALSGDAAGTGTFTIASPNSNSNFTLTLPQANTTVVGTDATQTLTNKTIDGSQLVAGSVTATQLASAAQPLGVGQTWQSVSRSNGVTYTNTTGRPIAAALSCWSSSQSGYFYINGSNVYLALGRSTYFDTLPLFIVIPAGATYSTSGLDYIGLWMELR